MIPVMSCLLTDSVCFIDIIFILDSSESAKDVLFDKQKEFVSLLSDKVFLMKPNRVLRYDVKLAIMQFSSSVRIDHPFTAWRDLNHFKQEVSRMTYIGHGTYSYYAISNATQLFKMEGRETAVKVALLMSDGIDHPKSPDVRVLSEAARALGIAFITIGLSQIANPSKLRLISGDSPGKPVLILNDPSLSDKVRDQLVGNILEYTFLLLLLFFFAKPIFMDSFLTEMGDEGWCYIKVYIYTAYKYFYTTYQYIFVFCRIQHTNIDLYHVHYKCIFVDLKATKVQRY